MRCSLNCMGFTRTCLTICKYTYIKSINCALSQSSTFLKNFFLRTLRSEYSIKKILSITLPCFNLDCHFIRYFSHVSTASTVFCIYWSNSTKYSYLSFHIFNLIMQLSSFLLLLFVFLLAHFNIFYCLSKFLLYLCVFLFQVFRLRWLLF